MNLTPNQAKAIDRMDTTLGYAVFDDPGVGKTATVLEAINAYAERESIDTVLVVCPAQARSVWDDGKHAELLRLCRYTLAVESYVGSRVQHSFARTQLTNGYGHSRHSIRFMVVSYETLRLISGYRNIAQRLEGNRKYWVILDESHKCKSTSTQSYRACRDISENASRITLLSGSPIDGGNENLWAQMHILNLANDDDRVGAIDRSTFISEYCWHEDMDEGAAKDKWAKRNAQSMARVYGPYMQTTRMEDVWTLPPSTHSVIDVRLLHSTWESYRSVIDDLVLAFRTSNHPDGIAVNNSMIAMGKASAICAGHMQHGGESVPSSFEKVSAAIAWIREQTHPDTYVMWTRFRNEADLLESFLRMKSVRGDIPPVEVVSIRGGQSNRERQRVVRIMADKSHRYTSVVCVCNLASGEHGISMVSACKALYLSMDWSVKQYRQTLARLLRKGQDRQVDYSYLISVPPIGAVTKKQKGITVDRIIYDKVTGGERLQCVSRAEWGRVIERL